MRRMVMSARRWMPTHDTAARRWAAAAATPAASTPSLVVHFDTIAVWRRLESQAAQRLANLKVDAGNFTVYRTKLSEGAVGVKPSATLAAALASAKSVGELVQAYEVIVDSIRRLDKTRQVEQLEYYHLKDQIKLASKLKPGELEKKKVALEETKKKIDKLTADINAISKANFTTASVNELLNVLRVVGHGRDDAHTLATMVLDEMTGLLQVPIDESTQVLSRNIIFGDGPAEDSGVLFSLVENPERGEVHVEHDGVTAIADRVLHTIAQRHDTKITEGVKLQQHDTFPMLQRSSD